MAERKLSTRRHVQSFPCAFAFSFNVTMSVLNLPNYLAGTPFQARKVFSGLQFLHLRPKILWYYFAAGQLPGAKTPGRISRKERTRNALGLNKHRHRLITIANAVLSLFVLSHCISKCFVPGDWPAAKGSLGKPRSHGFFEKALGTRLPIWLVSFEFSLRPSY